MVLVCGTLLCPLAGCSDYLLQLEQNLINSKQPQVKPTEPTEPTEPSEPSVQPVDWDTDDDGTLSILAIGNSFSEDALQYVYEIATDLGIEKVVLGNIYKGGCSLQKHSEYMANDSGSYTYFYNDNGEWTKTYSYKASTALESRSWDYITLQQASGDSGYKTSYMGYLEQVVDYVKGKSINKNVRLAWHMTWAYQQDSTHVNFAKYDNDQMTMYNAILAAVESKIVPNENFAFIIPSGTAVQNSRTSSLGDTTTRDGFHLSYSYGRYLAGLMFVKTLTGQPLDDLSYKPKNVSEEEMRIAIACVNAAAEKPFEATTIK